MLNYQYYGIVQSSFTSRDRLYGTVAYVLASFLDDHDESTQF